MYLYIYLSIYIYMIYVYIYVCTLVQPKANFHRQFPRLPPLSSFPRLPVQHAHATGPLEGLSGSHGPLRTGSPQRCWHLADADAAGDWNGTYGHFRKKYFFRPKLQGIPLQNLDLYGNVKSGSGLINTPLLINFLLPPNKMQFKKQVVPPD